MTDQRIRNAWACAKAGEPVEEPGCSAEALYRALFPRRFEILAHYMAHPGAPLVEAAQWLGCPVSWLRDEVDRLMRAGMLEPGLFGLTAAADLRGTAIPGGRGSGPSIREI
ncbi:MAG: hypothetical protein JSR19_01185 [Proteobacteria bacterium]|nr:hypothetical protein [Pseudomonadota bacterium]HQR03052.1 hypothetical protein [Rhodocyclaceae bacterium]